MLESKTDDEKKGSWSARVRDLEDDFRPSGRGGNPQESDGECEEQEAAHRGARAEMSQMPHPKRMNALVV